MFSLRLSRRPSGWLTLGAWSAALVFAAWAGADLVKRFITPPPVSAAFTLTTDPRAAAQQIVARAPLASAGQAPAPLATGAGGTARHQLVGVATGFGHAPGFALLRQAGGPIQSAMVGDTLAPGVRLLRLHADRVDIDYDGQVESLPLIREPASMPPTPPAQPSSARAGQAVRTR